MFRQLLQYLFGRRMRNSGLSNEDLNRLDVAFENNMTPFDCEKVMVEKGEVVGETAIINDRQELERTGGRLPEK